MPPRSGQRIAAVASRLRAAGSVFAEDEAAILVEAAADDAELEQLVRRRVSGEPLEPIVGWVRFGRLRLAVGSGVFVPRQRSLRLARLAVRRVRSAHAPVMLEAYCGVAPLAAMVAASVPGAEVHAADRDPTALAIARRNLPAGAGVHVADALDGLPGGLRGRLTTIAAVPPYVPEPDLVLMPREAREHEPASALVGGGPDGLGHTRRLIGTARTWMTDGGSVLLELHAAQLPVAATEARSAGWRTRVHPPTESRTGVLELIAG
ncbi:N5-glutamine methyltransferase family protein [Agromyces bracchium]|uniref:SAM-dependent methyltransferase n=1 Tax=Agromyces bracchium TaxID=88376 RepID=A0A6I3M3X2_9MICO|nr:SAM-dependent methyltransferase [Agromyces bracchium]MTH68034.1 SAM-dependent methyltransferase [Agromyces bracchium]